MRRGGLGGAVGKFALLGAGIGLLAACSGPGSVGNTLGNLVLFNSTTPPPATTTPSATTTPQEKINLTCPEIEVQEGTSSIRVYSGAEQSNANLRYQFSLGDTARDCQLIDGQLNIKVGVAGRVLAGPAGAPPTFTVPVRIVIRRESDNQPAVSQLYPVAATIQPGETGTDFTIVSDPLIVPYLHPDSDRDYTILVGFDQGAPAEKAPAKGRKRS